MKIALILTALLLPRIAPAQAATVDEASGLVIAPGWELVRTHCGGCHSHAMVTGQRADRQTWLDTLRWMQATQNLWQFDAATENGILDYLATNYPPQPNRRRAPIPPTLMPKASAESL
jgi:mono/diheme cytochrome c family protein